MLLKQRRKNMKTIDFIYLILTALMFILSFMMAVTGQGATATILMAVVGVILGARTILNI